MVTASKLFAAKSRIGPTAEVPREATARAALSDGSVYLEAALFACRRANAICSSEYRLRFMASPPQGSGCPKKSFSADHNYGSGPLVMPPSHIASEAMLPQ